MKDKLGWKIVIKFVALRPKTFSYLIDNGTDNKNVKRTKKCVIKRRNNFKNYKNCLVNNGIIFKI